MKIRPSAQGIPFSDTGFTATNVQAAVIEAKNVGAAHAPSQIFTRAGNTTIGTYLSNGSSPSNSSPVYMKGNQTIKSISIICNTLAPTTTRYQLTRRTALGVFSDITGAFVDLPAGSSEIMSNGLSVSVSDGWAIACYAVSGSTLNGPSVSFWTEPA